MKGIGRKLLIINTNLFLLIYLCVASVDYCAIEKQKCVFATREPHIGCDKTGITFRVNPNCTKIKLIKFSNRNKNYILKLHNEQRDKLAAGNVGKYPPASRMLEMFWDAELEATACLHAQYCVMDHDKCRATPTYDHPGQNLALASYTNHPQTNITIELHNAILAWFNEYPDVDPSIIEKYENRPRHKQYGHFTVMSKEINDRIGCCHITYESDLLKNDRLIQYGHLLTCNYRESNFFDRMTYTKGKAGSRCQDFGSELKISDHYKHLCTNPALRSKLTLEDEKEEDIELPKDYCELAKIKCGRNKHVGCERDSGFTVNSSCKNIKVHNMTASYKDLLLKEHNVYRDLVASGNHKNFPGASKMLEMAWDPSLEEVACAHVQYCHQHHAGCLATDRYSIPGQSLYAFHQSVPNKNHSEILTQAVIRWFNQSFAASSNIIDNFENTVSSHFGGFALMIKENQNKLGCCFITYEEFKNGINWHGHMVTCLYENIAYLNSQLYTKGKPASECNSYGDEYATSVTYENLCTKRNSVGSVRMNILTLMCVMLVPLVLFEFLK